MARKNLLSCMHQADLNLLLTSELNLKNNEIFQNSLESNYNDLQVKSQSELEIERAYELREDLIQKSKNDLFDELEGNGLVREILENPFNGIQDSYLLSIKNQRFPKQKKEELVYGAKRGSFDSIIIEAFNALEEEEEYSKMIDLEIAYTDDAILFTLDPNSIKLPKLGRKKISSDIMDLPLEKLEYSGVHPTNFKRIYNEVL